MRAFVALGELSPDDVDVQVVHGVIDHEDDLVGTTTGSLTLAEAYDGGATASTAPSPSSHSGAFGYTVRMHPARTPCSPPPPSSGVVALP